MSTSTISQATMERLIGHNRQVLEQARAVAQAYRTLPPACFADHTGPHLRHVIEHFDALLRPAQPGLVDYDHRPRDRALELHADLAVARLQVLIDTLDTLGTAGARGPGPQARLDDALVVRAQVGAWGQWTCDLASTLGRELAVLSSHAVHHFALLRSHCQRHGIAVEPDFGIAPSTLAHAAASAARSSQPSPIAAPLESPCPVY